MSDSLFGYRNVAIKSSILAGSEEQDMGASKIAGSLGSPSSGWQTANTITRARDGAWLQFDPGSEQNWRAFLLARTNLTPSAKVRWRVGAKEAANGPKPTIEVDCSTGELRLLAGTGSLTSARSGTAFHCQKDGTWVETSSNTLRFHHDPVTLQPVGVLGEAGSVNRVRNPRFEGMVYPSTPATNMSVITGGGMSLEWLGVETRDGIPGVYLHLFGTVTTGGLVKVYLDTTSGIAATNNQVCPISMFLQLVADYGGIAGITDVRIGYEVLDASAVLLATLDEAVTPGISGIDRFGATRRYVRASAAGGATTAFVRPFVLWNIADGTTVDFAVWVGGPQLEVNQSLVSTPHFAPIGTPGAHTRGGEIVIFTPTAGLIDSTKGSFYVEFMAPSYVHPGFNGGNSVLRIDNGTANELYNIRAGSNLLSSLGTLQSDLTMTVATVAVVDTAPLPSPPVRPLSDINNETPIRAGIAYSDNTVDFSAEGFTISPAYSGTLPSGLSRFLVTGSANGTNASVLRWRYYNERISLDQLAGLTTDGNPLSPSSVYDSGWVTVGETLGGGQSLALATATVTGQYARCDIDDPTNPDGFINIPLIYAGPVWQPSVGVAWESTYDPQGKVNTLETRGGQEFAEPLFRKRAWSLSMTGVLDAEVWSEQQPLDIVAASGANVLFIPDSTSAHISRESVFGILKAQAPLGFSTRSKNFRSWRARITERL